ncbi:MAG: NAD(P)/FAD-dependent oxidoreductase [Proteobacteria bacterium]|nr:NAD(P)/FAD-dependent oxidoreductase [Pseudomonadota bacterium]
MQSCDVLIIGAGAAGLMCGIETAKRQRQVIIIDHANKPGKKILMSGGGRCNFTNYNISPNNYISHNPHFCKSALSRYTQWDFIALVKKHQIPFHEKAHGQLFCDDKAKDIVNMLLSEFEGPNAKLHLNESIESIEKLADDRFMVKTNIHKYQCQSLVIATGGLSIPTMGATPFGYQVAKQFNILVWPVRAGLVPLTLHTQDKERFSTLSGISCDSLVTCKSHQWRENILFTHRGLSGPAILQISNFWQSGDTITINLLPEIDLFETLKSIQKSNPQRQLKEALSEYLPKRLIAVFLMPEMADKPLQMISHSQFHKLAQTFQKWQLLPNATEGYRTAEVTLGGVDCHALSSKTMEAINVKGLYFIGEVIDVTGALGGFNFQWAWSSGWAAGQVA